MKIAIVGAGFSGVAAAWELLGIEGVKVNLFDVKGIGGGASGVAAGLLHPYVGAEGKKSWKSEEAMASALELIAIAEETLGYVVADRSGILRKGPLEKLYDDVIPQEDGTYLITSGVTVYSQLYLKGLWASCVKKGAMLQVSTIESLNQLEGYDRVILTVGAGIFNFVEAHPLNLRKTKGQVLVCASAPDRPILGRSVVGKGYLAMSEIPGQFYAGSTYERGPSLSDEPCLKTALLDLQPKVDFLDPEMGPLDVLECRAGTRVNRSGHYIPLLEKLTEKCYAITGMGSRGLLYHALFAKMLKEKIEIA